MFTVAEICRVTGGVLRRGEGNGRVTQVSTDTRTLQPGALFVALKGDRFDGHDFLSRAAEGGAGALLVRSGSGRTKKTGGCACIEVADTLRALGLLAAHHRSKFSIPVIAITGSSGKTTTKDMVRWVLSGATEVLGTEGTQNNHIGCPLTLLKLRAQHRVAVVEIGTNHFGEVAYLTGICRPTVGLITNIGPAHLEFFGSEEGVYREKFDLIRGLRAPRIAVLNADDRFLARAVRAPRKRYCSVGYGLYGPCDYVASRIGFRKGNVVFTVNRASSGDAAAIPLCTPGYHNVYNALAATAVARLLGLEYGLIRRRLASFVFPAGRFTLCAFRSTRIIDDTYNANPLSLTQALNALRHYTVGGRKILILGDMRELGVQAEAFHAEAGRRAASVCDCLVTVGPLAAFAAESARTLGIPAQRIVRCATSAEARGVLLNKIRPGRRDIVLIKGSRAMRMEEIFKEQER